MFNPYKYMLEIRNNRILFQYLDNAAVHFSDTTGWTIHGYSDEGETEIYEIAGGLIRFTLPIKVPDFITKDILHKILDGLNTSMEGITTIAEEGGELFIEYHLHAIVDLDNKVLDKALMKFLEERKEIKQGFSSLKEDYEKMKDAFILNTIQNKAAPPPNPSGPPNTTEDMDSMDSLWNEMENIDKQLYDEDEDEDDLPFTDPAA